MYSELKNNIIKYVAIVYYYIRGYNDKYYIIYDIEKNDCYNLSEEAVLKIANQTLNLELDTIDTVLQHTDRIIKLVFMNDKIDIKIIRDNKNIVLELYNVRYDNKDNIITYAVDKICEKDNEGKIYQIGSNLIAVKISNEGFVKLELTNINGAIENTLTKKTCEYKTYKHNLFFVNNDEEVNNKLKQFNNKLKLLNSNTIDAKYIVKNGKTILVGLETDENEKELRIPDFIDEIGRTLSIHLLARVNNKKKILRLNNKQLDSIRYYVNLTYDKAYSIDWINTLITKGMIKCKDDNA